MEYRLTINKMKYGWSKWGGANHGLVKEELDEWYCQGCGKKQVKGLPSYMLPITHKEDRDFARVCSKCEHEIWFNRIRKTFVDLRKYLDLQTKDIF